MTDLKLFRDFARFPFVDFLLAMPTSSVPSLNETLLGGDDDWGPAFFGRLCLRAASRRSVRIAL